MKPVAQTHTPAREPRYNARYYNHTIRTCMIVIITNIVVVVVISFVITVLISVTRAYECVHAYAHASIHVYIMHTCPSKHMHACILNHVHTHACNDIFSANRLIASSLQISIQACSAAPPNFILMHTAP